MSRPTRVLGFVLALVGLSMGGQVAQAATVVASSGTPGAYHETNSASKNGATCSYASSTALTSIKVRGPRVFANAHNSSGEWVGWQLIVQRTTGSSGGSWVTTHKGKIHEAWATGTQAAAFRDRTWTLPQPSNHRFRIKVLINWYHFSENGPQPVEGSVTLRLQHYDLEHSGTSYPDHPNCAGYFI